MTTTSRKVEADKVIGRIALLAGGSSFVPTTLLQGGAMTFLGYKLVKDLTEVYEIPFENNEMTVGIRSLILSVITQVIGEGLESALEGNKNLSGLGNFISAPIINSFLFLTMGNIYRDHFEAGGTLESLDTGNFIEIASKQLTFDNIKNNLSQSTNRDYASLISDII